MSTPPQIANLTERQDSTPPERISREIPNLGLLHGYIWPNGVQQFYGIPYGQFSKNWTRSTLVESWVGQAHDGTKLGPWALQPVPWSFVSSHSSVPVQPYSYLNAPDENDNKNCLTINLTIPPDTATDADKTAPVLVFIHGGAFIFGSSYFPAYDGYRLVSEAVRKGRPIVYASFNYRIGLLGFLASEDIRHQLHTDGFSGNGNFGLTDQQLALEWIQRFIRIFGGDKDNVTIFGESAGAMSVAAHVASRKGKELFHRAAQLSGGLGSFKPFTEQEHEIFYESLLRVFNIPVDAPDRLKRLQAIDDDQIVGATVKVFKTLIAIPSLCNDGWFFEDGYYSPFETKLPPAWLKALMTGETRDEGMIFRDELWNETPDSVQQRLRHLLPDPDAVSYVESSYGITQYMPFADKERVLEDIAGDAFMRIPNIAIADAAVAQSNLKEGTNLQDQVPIYLYHFDQRCSFPDNIYHGDSYHALDLLYIFLTRYEGMNAEERPVADAMHSAFIDFAYGIAPWEEYRVANRWKVWGPDGNMRLLSEKEDEGARSYERMRELWKKDWYPEFFRFAEDVTIRRYKIFEGTGYEY